MTALLDQAMAAGDLRALDLYFARWLDARWGGGCQGVSLAAALLSRQVGDGHVCLALSDWSGRAAFRDRGGHAFGIAPAHEVWSEALRRSPAVGEPGEWTPLILDGDRLYLGRLWAYEQRLAADLVARARTWVPNVDRMRLRTGLRRLFPGDRTGVDWQKIAACLAVLRHLLVLSGGPGTGKTRTVTSILALILEQAPETRIALAAPTGKAAARLRESIVGARSQLPLDNELSALLPSEAMTLHRLLGTVQGRARFRHCAENPLPVDVLVVDEASMVDLPMMAKLVDALPSDARLILLGDKDQLASVEAGSVLGDVCLNAENHFGDAVCDALRDLAGASIEPAPRTSALSDNVVLLRRSYRFRDAGGIGALAAATNAGDADAVVGVLEDSGQDDIVWQRSDGEDETAMMSAALPFACRHLECHEPGEAIDVFGRSRILCVLRDGPRGVSGVNAAMERLLSRSGVIPVNAPLYSGMPIMIARNLPAVGLFNGDVGLLWEESGGEDALSACFVDPDGDIRRIHPGRLPAFESAYAMTVHKSQGSEFERVLVVLPRQDARVLSRELLYTAITRARACVEICGSEALIRGAVSRRVARGSGLADRLV